MKIATFIMIIDLMLYRHVLYVFTKKDSWLHVFVVASYQYGLQMTLIVYVQILSIVLESSLLANPLWCYIYIPLSKTDYHASL